jgi:3-dehydroquinate dehydratase II
MKIMVINGANLNMLGLRETSIYGTTTLDDIESLIRRKAFTIGIEVDFFQSNHEGDLIDKIQKAPAAGIQAFILNPGGYTHTSVALRDALLSVNLPFIEVHLSKVASREQFRQINYFSDIAAGSITGFGPLGYELAVEALWGLYGKKAQ